jgi:ABC-2 type transport system permease protein
MSVQVTAATAHRVLLQLHGDRRTVALLLVVPGLLLALTNRMFDSQPDFNRVGLSLLGIFPFTTMFLVTSVAMLRERTRGTLERLLSTPLVKLELLLGYGIAFAVAATAQALVTAAIAYGPLGLYTPGAPIWVVGVAVLSAVMGTSLGLLSSAFATSEFQAVQFMPAVVMPQVLLGGLFVPREQMAPWLERVSDLLPLTYDIDALQEVGRTAVVTPELLGDLVVMIGVTVLALALAAGTLRRRAGGLPRNTGRTVAAVLATALALGAFFAAAYWAAGRDVVSTDDARIDGDRITLLAPASGVLVGWQGSEGSLLRRGQIVGRIRSTTSSGHILSVLRAPADGTIARADVTEGGLVAEGATLAVAFDPSAVYVTALVEETDVAGILSGQRVVMDADALPGVTLFGRVRDVGAATDAQSSATPTDNLTGVFQRVTQRVPVRIWITGPVPEILVPGMSVTVHIHRD